MLNKFIISFCFVFGVIFLWQLPGSISAGGCCYVEVKINQGTTGLKGATFYISFIDPSVFQPLVNKRIEIKIVDPLIGQYCKLDSDNTDANGGISGTCYSHTPGTMKIYFYFPDLSQSDNDIIGYYKQEVHFQRAILPVPRIPVLRLNDFVKRIPRPPSLNW